SGKNTPNVQAPKTNQISETESKNISEQVNIENLNFTTLGKWLKSTTSKHFQFEMLQPWTLFYVFLGVLLTMIVGKLAQWFIESHLIKLAAKTSTELDDIACKAIGKPLFLLIFSLGFLASAGPLLSLMSPMFKSVFIRLLLALAASAVAWALYRLIAVINHLLAKLAESTENNLDDLVVAIIRKALKITVLAISILFIGQNILHLNITTLLAGAGVMGLAVAFAAQDTIANFFGSIMIILDQPFKVGERVKLGEFNGTIENVGFRSTRLRTLDGHLVTIPNKKVADEAAENIGRRPYIKQVNNFTLVYDTTPDKMEQAIEILHEILDEHEGQNPEKPPRIYFNSFNDWALNILVIVWYHPGDYFAFQEWNHKTNLEILRRFNDEGLEFAFPTNTTYLAYDPKRELSVKVQDIEK
ncbi:MAG: mechanosensitive ion channel family protein, partial [Victivallales bacterium]|nr:mechanosensitive ion channel family protein [Victivallales bacterium]